VAKAAPVPLDPGMSFAEAAALTVSVRAGELWEHSENVLDTSDIERVHDMRVATRRLRAVLEIFQQAFPSGPHGEILEEVKALADALGERRDPDVHLEALAGLEEAMGEEARPGLEVFASRIRAEQAQGNATLAAALQHADDSDLRGRIKALIAEASA
jgi:CHAD domain-containing protein